MFFDIIFSIVFGPPQSPLFEVLGLPLGAISARVKSSGGPFGTQGADFAKTWVPKWTPFWPKLAKCHQKHSPRGRLLGSVGALGGSLALLGVSWGALGGLWVLWGVLLALLGCFGCSGVFFSTSECALAVVFCLSLKRPFSTIPFKTFHVPCESSFGMLLAFILAAKAPSTAKNRPEHAKTQLVNDCPHTSFLNTPDP